MRSHKLTNSSNPLDDGQEQLPKTFVDITAELVTDRGLTSTFFGIGLDVNTAVPPSLGNIPGCAYFACSIDKAKREQLLSQQFEYKVCPAASNVFLELHASPFIAETVCGGGEISKDALPECNQRAWCPRQHDSCQTWQDSGQ